MRIDYKVSVPTYNTSILYRRSPWIRSSNSSLSPWIRSINSSLATGKHSVTVIIIHISVAGAVYRNEKKNNANIREINKRVNKVSQRKERKTP